MRLTNVPSGFAVQQESQAFEARWLQTIGGGNMLPDPAWTQLYPWTRPDGGVVRRRAYFVAQPFNQQYVFETLASKAGTFLGVAAVRHQFLPQVQQLQFACMQNQYVSPQCPAVIDDVRWQVLMTIATHLSSYVMT